MKIRTSLWAALAFAVLGLTGCGGGSSADAGTGVTVQQMNTAIQTAVAGLATQAQVTALAAQIPHNVLVTHGSSSSAFAARTQGIGTHLVSAPAGTTAQTAIGTFLGSCTGSVVAMNCMGAQTSQGYLYQLNTAGGTTNVPLTGVDAVYYDGANCQGNPYLQQDQTISTYALQLGLVISPSDGNFVGLGLPVDYMYIPTGEQPVSVDLVSVATNNGATCETYGLTVNAYALLVNDPNVTGVQNALVPSVSFAP